MGRYLQASRAAAGSRRPASSGATGSPRLRGRVGREEREEAQEGLGGARRRRRDTGGEEAQGPNSITPGTPGPKVTTRSRLLACSHSTLTGYTAVLREPDAHQQRHSPQLRASPRAHDSWSTRGFHCGWREEKLQWKTAQVQEAEAARIRVRGSSGSVLHDKIYATARLNRQRFVDLAPAYRIAQDDPNVHRRDWPGMPGRPRRKTMHLEPTTSIPKAVMFLDPAGRRGKGMGRRTRRKRQGGNRWEEAQGQQGVVAFPQPRLRQHGREKRSEGYGIIGTCSFAWARTSGDLEAGRGGIIAQG